jgi:hypothetical protein
MNHNYIISAGVAIYFIWVSRRARKPGPAMMATHRQLQLYYTRSFWFLHRVFFADFQGRGGKGQFLFFGPA